MGAVTTAVRGPPPPAAWPSELAAQETLPICRRGPSSLEFVPTVVKVSLCSHTRVEWIPTQRRERICINRYLNKPSREIEHSVPPHTQVQSLPIRSRLLRLALALV